MRAVGQEFKISLSTVRYWVKKHEIKLTRHLIVNWDIERLKEAVTEAKSKREVLHLLGLRDSGSIYTQLNKVAKEYKIELPSYVPTGETRAKKLDIEYIFSKGSKVSNSTLRSYMIKYFKISYECKICKLTEWQQQKLVIQVDHIDGNHKNNEISNLRFLCPNCHSQTKTFCRRNLTNS